MSFAFLTVELSWLSETLSLETMIAEDLRVMGVYELLYINDFYSHSNCVGQIMPLFHERFGHSL